MFLFRIRNTFRQLKKNIGFSVINIVGLAFGFTCALLIILHVIKEKSYNSNIPNHEHVFQLLQKDSPESLGNTSISYALTPMLAEHYSEIKYYARTENHSWFRNCVVSYQSENGEKKIFNESSFYLADVDLFKIIEYPFIEGSNVDALDEPNSIVLTDRTAEKYFGKESALGKTLILNNEQSFKVSGVVKIPEYVTFHFSMVVPIKSVRSEEKLAGWNSNGQPYFMLHDNIDYEAFNKKIEHFYNENLSNSNNKVENITLSFLPMSERRLHYNKNPLYLLIFIGVVVLIVSMLNYINMSTSLVQKRTSEIALKKISGASNNNIGWQFMRETFFIGFMAIMLGVILTIIGMPLFKDLVGSDVKPFLIAHKAIFITGSILVWVVSSIIAGFYPALILSGVRPLLLFRKGGGKQSGTLSKNLLITFQFTISIILIVLTLMINRQYRHMENMSLGFDNEMVMQIPFTNKLKDSFVNLKDELKQISSVKDVCAASSMPAGIPNHSGVNWIDDSDEKQEDSFGFAIVSDGYTQTFDMQMAMGNEFTSERLNELKGVIINETAANRLGYENPIGQQIHFWGKDNAIIGVVKDFQNNYMFNKVKPMIISAHPDNQHFTKYLFVSVKPIDIENTIDKIKQTTTQFSPGIPFEYSFTSVEVMGYINEIKELNRTFRFASFVAIILALIGLIALTYHATQSRIKEIGVRKVNGAKVIEIVHMLNQSLMKSVLVAIIVASPIAWYIVTLLLQGIDNRTTIAWWVFLLGGAIIGVTALVTVSLQSWWSATRNPVDALRYE